jgi:hypothetical protein
MIGLPGDVNLSLDQILTGESGEFMEWRAFHDPGIGELQEYHRINPLKFSPGRGFWILCKNNIVFDTDIKHVTLDEDNTYSININYEWNIITNPFNHNIYWDIVKSVNNVNSPIQYWDGSNYVQFETLEPYKGVYFFNRNQNRNTLKIPYRNILHKTSFPNTADTENEIQIILKKDEKDISKIRIGYCSDSEDGLDIYDVFTPPGYFSNYQMFIHNENLQTNYKFLECDYRQSIGEGQVYDIYLKLSSNEPIELFLYENILHDQNIYLIDKESNTTINFKEFPKMSIIPTTKSKNYLLVIGKEEFVESLKDELLPIKFLLFQNYPNPFNSVTNIRYGLPENTRISLKIFDVLGGEIRILDEGNKSAGYFDINWNGKDKYGFNLSSGIYFYKLETDKLSIIKKMILLK